MLKKNLNYQLPFIIKLLEKATKLELQESGIKAWNQSNVNAYISKF
jgi:hypothetical protein